MGAANSAPEALIRTGEHTWMAPGAFYQPRQQCILDVCPSMRYRTRGRGIEDLGHLADRRSWLDGTYEDVDSGGMDAVTLGQGTRMPWRGPVPRSRGVTGWEETNRPRIDVHIHEEGARERSRPRRKGRKHGRWGPVMRGGAGSDDDGYLTDEEIFRGGSFSDRRIADNRERVRDDREAVRLRRVEREMKNLNNQIQELGNLVQEQHRRPPYSQPRYRTSLEGLGNDPPGGRRAMPSRPQLRRPPLRLDSFSEDDVVVQPWPRERARLEAIRPVREDIHKMGPRPLPLPPRRPRSSCQHDDGPRQAPDTSNKIRDNTRAPRASPAKPNPGLQKQRRADTGNNRNGNAKRKGQVPRREARQDGHNDPNREDREQRPPPQRSFREDQRPAQHSPSPRGSPEPDVNPEPPQNELQPDVPQEGTGVVADDVNNPEWQHFQNEQRLQNDMRDAWRRRHREDEERRLRHDKQHRMAHRNEDNEEERVEQTEARDQDQAVGGADHQEIEDERADREAGNNQEEPAEQRQPVDQYQALMLENEDGQRERLAARRQYRQAHVEDADEDMDR